MMNDSKMPMMRVEDAARWLCRMAGADGVVSPRERRLMWEFAMEYGVELESLVAYAESATKVYQYPEVETIDRNVYLGRKFEEFVVSLFSNRIRYGLLFWRGDKRSGDIYALENLLPDLHLRHKLDGGDVQYFVECKYRSSWGDGVFDFSRQFLRYRREAKERNMELFLALGVGGTPSAPEEFYLVPGRMIGYEKAITREGYFRKCRCQPTSEAFHQYINHYFNKRVFKITE